METKPFWKSKIVWLGIIQTVIGALGVAQDYMAKGVIGPNEIILIATGILTVVLRVWFTSTTLT